MPPEEHTMLGGRYELLEMTGQGGMAVVWKAMMHGAAGFHRPVAVKRILVDLCDEEFITMFMEEARVGSHLHHPNIVQIIDFGVDSAGSYYLVMEWIEGINFQDFMKVFRRRDEMLSWYLVAAIGIEALRGLQAAHERIDSEGNRSPVIHRDVTPSNILIGDNGIIRLTDFGVSRAMDRSSWTSPDIVKGKLTYMAPEIFDDVPASVQSDLFSLGIVLWEALAGRKLYKGKSAVEIFIAARQAAIPPLTDFRDDLPPVFIETLMRVMDPDPANRFRSALEMYRTLIALTKRVDEPMDEHVVAEIVNYARHQAEEPVASEPVSRTMSFEARNTRPSPQVEIVSPDTAVVEPVSLEQLVPEAGAAAVEPVSLEKLVPGAGAAAVEPVSLEQLVPEEEVVIPLTRRKKDP